MHFYNNMRINIIYHYCVLSNYQWSGFIDDIIRILIHLSFLQNNLFILLIVPLDKNKLCLITMYAIEYTTYVQLIISITSCEITSPTRQQLNY
jgi:hypothetical protein